MSDEIPLILFAKAPIAGKVKTRLTTHCTEQQAADIAELLMEASIQRACGAWPGKVYLSVWLDHSHSFFNKMLQSYPVLMIHQCEGDLGEKMREALDSQGYPAAVMGCDVPHVSVQSLAAAHDSLVQGKSVIGPALDGGYYLLGLTEPADALFLDKQWGQGSVLSDTLTSANASGLSLHELKALNDVDEWGDLLEAANQVPSLHGYLQAQKLI